MPATLMYIMHFGSLYVFVHASRICRQVYASPAVVGTFEENGTCVTATCKGVFVFGLRLSYSVTGALKGAKSGSVYALRAQQLSCCHKSMHNRSTKCITRKHVIKSDVCRNVAIVRMFFVSWFDTCRSRFRRPAKRHRHHRVQPHAAVRADGPGWRHRGRGAADQWDRPADRLPRDGAATGSQLLVTSAHTCACFCLVLVTVSYGQGKFARFQQFHRFYSNFARKAPVLCSM